MGLTELWQRCNRIKTFQQMALKNLDFVRKENLNYYIAHTPHYKNKLQGLHIKYKTIKLIGKRKQKAKMNTNNKNHKADMNLFWISGSRKGKGFCTLTLEIKSISRKSAEMDSVIFCYANDFVKMMERLICPGRKYLWTTYSRRIGLYIIIKKPQNADQIRPWAKIINKHFTNE